MLRVLLPRSLTTMVMLLLLPLLLQQLLALGAARSSSVSVERSRSQQGTPWFLLLVRLLVVRLVVSLLCLAVPLLFLCPHQRLLLL